MYLYQKTNQYFAQISAGMEEIGAAELEELGAENIKASHRGIYFEADQKTLYRINYCSRMISRVLAPLKKFQCHQTRYLYSKAREIDWSDFFDADKTFAIFANVSHSKIRHSQYAALILKDAIVDQFRDATGTRPNIQKTEPDVWINLHIENNYATISWDTSGGSLHRRGYRVESVEAPMQETLAAAIIRLSEWQGTTMLYDPFCGSGTLLAEALMAYRNIPAGILRQQFGFEYLPDFDYAAWEDVKKESLAKIQKLDSDLIAGSDISGEAILIAKHNLTRLAGGDKIQLAVKDFAEIDRLENTTIVCNPPYGIRQGEKKEISKLYKSLGDFLKQKCQGSSAFIYFGDRSLIPAIGLKPSWRKPLRNGGLDGRLAKFEIY